jgi:hypothetical protein
MSIRVALEHRISYRFDRAVTPLIFDLVAAGVGIHTLYPLTLDLRRAPLLRGHPGPRAS